MKNNTETIKKNNINLKRYFNVKFSLKFMLAVLLLASAGISHGKGISGAGCIYSDTLCPVSGDKIGADHISFKYADKELKFCNEGCVMAFKKEPSIYTEHLLCMPCNDPDGKKDISTVHNGVKYYFCSGGCKEKFTANPDDYLNKFKDVK